MGKPIRNAHYEKLSRFLTEKLAVPNELQLLESSEEGFAKDLGPQLTTAQSIRFDFPYPRLVFTTFEGFPADLMFLRSADCAVNQTGRWWLRNLLTEAIRRLIVHSQINFDLSGKAVVVGTGAGARASIMALVKLGLRHLNVVSIDKPAFDVLEKDFKRFCFNVDLNYIPPDNIKLLGREHTILINSTPMGAENTLLEDLTFFNYLKDRAFVIDLNFDSADSTLVKEALSLGKYVFTGLDLMFHKDLYWLEVALQKTADLQVLQDYFKS